MPVSGGQFRKRGDARGYDKLSPPRGGASERRDDGCERIAGLRWRGRG